jgi:putative tricarboxylic transport membrane protein
MSLFVVNVLIMIFLLVATRPLLRIIQIPQRFLGVAIMGLSFVGVYSLRNSLVDCMICAGFGVFGYVLRRLNMPIVPIILGMVLGNIMEQKFRAGMARVKDFTDFIDRPISFSIFIIIIIVLAVHGRNLWRNYRA